MSNISELTKRVEKVFQEYQEKKEEWKAKEEKYLATIKDLEERNNDLDKSNEELQSSLNKLKSTDKENKRLEKEITKLQDEKEKNAVDIIELIDKEKGWSIREKELIDGFNNFKEKTYNTIKHLVEDVIEPLEQSALENPSSVAVEENLKEQIEELTNKKDTMNVTIRTNSGPEQKKLIVKTAEKELEELISSSKKPTSRSLKI